MVDVLLATYRPNAAFLEAQRDSLLKQQDVDVNLLTREDAEGLGPAENFSRLLAQSNADYVAFCDQDDVWQPRKLAVQLARMKELERRHGKDRPLLVFCDSTVTDETLRPQPGTFLSRQGVNPVRGISLPRLLVQNYIAGHAMLFNAALREKAGAIPHEALMHDYWVALVAAAFGQISFVDEPLVLYRQHGANALGHARTSRGARDFRSRFRRNVLQAQAFVDRFGEASPACVRALASFPTRGWFSRRCALFQHGLFKYGVTRNLALLALA